MKWLLLAPSLIIAGILVVWPIGELVIVSLHRTDFMSTSWVGLRNYIRMWSDQAFTRSLWNSIGYMLVMVPISVGGSVAISLLVMRESKKWHDSVRILLYIPLLSAGVIISQVWRWIFHIDGPINWVLSWFGIEAIQWFGHGWSAIPAIGFIVGTATMGGFVIIVLASILSVNSELFDAAQIDGASWLQIKVRIVLPIIAPIIGIMALMAAINAPQIWEYVYSLAPFEHSGTLAWRIYTEAFQMGRHGSAAAMSVVMCVLLMSMAWVKNRMEGRQ